MSQIKDVNSDVKETYYQAADDWRHDIYQSKTLWLRYSLIANAGLLLSLLLALLTLVCLVPLKQKVPYLYTFNHATGEVTKLGELEPTHLTANWQMTRFFLIHYVMNRESYDSDHLEIPYQLVWAQSSPTIRQQYDTEVDSQASTSPYHKYGKDKAIRVPKVWPSRLNDHTAVIRFEKHLIDKGTNTQQIAHEEAIVKWQYQSVKATQAQLDRNPLGFTVTYYQVTSVNLSHEEGK